MAEQQQREAASAASGGETRFAKLRHSIRLRLLDECVFFCLTDTLRQDKTLCGEFQEPQSGHPRYVLCVMCYAYYAFGARRTSNIRTSIDLLFCGGTSISSLRWNIDLLLAAKPQCCCLPTCVLTAAFCKSGRLPRSPRSQDPPLSPPWHQHRSWMQ